MSLLVLFFFTSPSSIWRLIRSVGGSCCFALPQLVEGPTREQPNTPRATLFAGRLASSCRHWFWLLEFDMDVIWCYVMLVLFIFSPWISLIFSKIYLVYFNWWMPHCCWNGLNLEWPPTESLAPRNMLAKSRQNLNSSIHHCIGMQQTIHAQAICQPCSDFGRQNHMLKPQTTYGKNGRKSWCSCSCGSLGSGGPC